MNYEELHNRLQFVDKDTKAELIKKCQKNGWLKRNGYEFKDGFLDEWSEDYEYSFVKTDEIDVLRSYFEYGNWSIRQGILYKDLAFINQVNGGDEWWTLKKFDNEWLDFESISCGFIIRRFEGRFEKMMEGLLKATYNQCKSLTYMEE
jgi:hypothetical protein